MRFETCNSVESITAIFQEQSRAFREFRGDDGKLMKPLHSAVHVLHTLSASTVLGESIGLARQQWFFWTLPVLMPVRQPFPPARAIFAGFAILLGVRISLSLFCAYAYHFAHQAVKDVSASFDAHVDLLECIGNFLKRLDIYTKIPPTPAMTEVVVKIMVELISTLALATKQVKQGRPSEYLPVDVSLN
jgi:hypothetical protein